MTTHRFKQRTDYTLTLTRGGGDAEVYDCDRCGVRMVRILGVMTRIDTATRILAKTNPNISEDCDVEIVERVLRD